jgi:hypothetical protein
MEYITGIEKGKVRPWSPLNFIAGCFFKEQPPNVCQYSAHKTAHLLIKRLSEHEWDFDKEDALVLMRGQGIFLLSNNQRLLRKPKELHNWSKEGF